MVSSTADLVRDAWLKISEDSSVRDKWLCDETILRQIRLRLPGGTDARVGPMPPGATCKTYNNQPAGTDAARSGQCRDERNYGHDGERDDEREAARARQNRNVVAPASYEKNNKTIHCGLGARRDGGTAKHCTVALGRDEMGGQKSRRRREGEGEGEGGKGEEDFLLLQDLLLLPSRPRATELRDGGTSELRTKITKQYTAALGLDEMGGQKRRRRREGEDGEGEGGEEEEDFLLLQDLLLLPLLLLIFLLPILLLLLLEIMGQISKYTK